MVAHPARRHHAFSAAAVGATCGVDPKRSARAGVLTRLPGVGTVSAATAEMTVSSLLGCLLLIPRGADAWTT
ncbi:hypothetical protein ACF05L_32370 [Streptomyces bobili]|uniref:hypothetical protein n=1 Tax=Streptomyces bobili TaxID=67280 RepID=UPI0036FED870